MNLDNHDDILLENKLKAKMVKNLTSLDKKDELGVNHDDILLEVKEKMENDEVVTETLEIDDETKMLLRGVLNPDSLNTAAENDDLINEKKEKKEENLKTENLFMIHTTNLKINPLLKVKSPLLKKEKKSLPTDEKEEATEEAEEVSNEEKKIKVYCNLPKRNTIFLGENPLAITGKNPNLETKLQLKPKKEKLLLLKKKLKKNESPDTMKATEEVTEVDEEAEEEEDEEVSILDLDDITKKKAKKELLLNLALLKLIPTQL